MENQPEEQKFDETAIQKIESYINKHIKGNLSKQYIEMLNFYMSQTTDFGEANAKKKLSRIAVKAIGLINNIVLSNIGNFIALYADNIQESTQCAFHVLSNLCLDFDSPCCFRNLDVSNPRFNTTFNPVDSNCE